jgi:hypothetical protein
MAETKNIELIYTLYLTVQTGYENWIQFSTFAQKMNYSLSSERLVHITITKLYVEKVVPSARKI